MRSSDAAVGLQLTPLDDDALRPAEPSFETTSESAREDVASPSLSPDGSSHVAVPVMT
jgi:hypothetical protein